MNKTTLILDRLKIQLEINTDVELAEILIVKPNTISTWKKRNSLDYEKIISICQEKSICLDKIFCDELPEIEDQKTYAVNFTDFCMKANSIEEIAHALKFFMMPFDVFHIPVFFENWNLKLDDSKYRKGKYLTNTHSNGKWKTTITINDDVEYTFAENPNCWIYLPATWSEFISDILRYEDFELIFSKQALKLIYFEKS